MLPGSRRSGLGTLADQAGDLRTKLSGERGSSVAGASALTGGELRLLPTHLSFPEIAEELFLSRHTVKSQAKSLYRKLGACSRGRRSLRRVSWGSWRADRPISSHWGDGTRPGMRWDGVLGQ